MILNTIQKFLYVLTGIMVLPAVSQTYFTRVTDTGDLNASANGSYASSWGDINNDGYMDLLVIKSPTLLMLLNDGDGTFSSINSGHLVQTNFYQNSAVFGDYNNDGNLDVYISNLGPNTPIQPGQPLFPQINFLYKNSGAPDYTFEYITGNGLDTDSNMTWTSSWTDFDNDGDIDMFVPGDQGDKDLFFENTGDGTFMENEELLFLNPGEFSAAGSWTDFDNDGDQDLLVVNYQGVNNELYKNNLIEGGIDPFSQILSTSIVLDYDYDLAPSFGDYNNDGLMDVFLGTWLGRKNLLFKNNGNFLFQKISNEPVTEQTWTLAYTWLDFDNDGFLDVFVANSQGESNSLYKNNGNGTFTKSSFPEAGDIVKPWGSTSGSAVADYDNDGDIDIYVPGSQASLFRNNIGSSNNWIHVSCEGTESNKLGIGARILVKAQISAANAVWQVRDIHGGPTGDRAQNSQRAHFGLGSANKIDSLCIEWPSGIKDIYLNVEVNQFIKVVEGKDVTHVEREKGLAQQFILQQNYPNPFNPETTITYTLHKTSDIRINVYNLLGQKIRTLVDLKKQKPGILKTVWDGRNDTGIQVPSGMYIYQMQSENVIISRRMILLR